VLVVDDGFTPGARGLYEIVVDPSGSPSDPRLLAKYQEEFPTSSSVDLLDDGRYAVATRRFPSVAEDQITLTVSAIDRETTAQAPGTETLYSEKQAFLGGTEPAYISMLVRGKNIDVAYTLAEQGGVVGVTHLEQGGSAWKAVRTTKAPLPDGVLPLSGDCLLWPHGDGLTLRVGFENFAVLQIDAAGTATPFVKYPDSDIPIYSWGDQLLLLRYGDENPSTHASAVQYVLSTPEPKDLAVDEGGVIQDGIEPYKSLPYAGGALVVPLSQTPEFPTIDVGFRSPTEGLHRIASIAREGTDELYSARAFVNGGHIFVAWTAYHESLVDLWVAAAPLTSAPAAATKTATTKPRRLRSMPVPPGFGRPRRRGRGR
jgi:hypothetical protein